MVVIVELEPEMPTGSLEPMRPDPRVRGPVPSSSRICRCAPSRAPPAFGSHHLDLQISRPALRPHLRHAASMAVAFLAPAALKEDLELVLLRRRREIGRASCRERV